MTTGRNFDWDNIRSRLARCQTLDVAPSLADRNLLHDVFQQRAHKLAERSQKAIHTAQTPILVFQLGNERFGIQLIHVKQVFARVPVTPVPGTGDLALNVANLNGTLCSIVDLSVLLNVPTPQPDDGNVVLVHVMGQMLGVLVGSLDGVCHIEIDSLATTDQAAPNALGRFMRGITETRIAVLDAKALMEHVAKRSRDRKP
jgi:purine-binding chemotaxis protein CheW